MPHLDAPPRMIDNLTHIKPCSRLPWFLDSGRWLPKRSLGFPRNLPARGAAQTLAMIARPESLISFHYYLGNAGRCSQLTMGTAVPLACSETTEKPIKHGPERKEVQGSSGLLQSCMVCGGRVEALTEVRVLSVNTRQRAVIETPRQWESEPSRSLW